MNVMESEPAEACTITWAMPLNVAGRDAVITPSLHDETASKTGPGYAVTWHPEHFCPKPTPLIVIVPPDVTTTPATLDRRGPTE